MFVNRRLIDSAHPFFSSNWQPLPTSIVIVGLLGPFATDSITSFEAECIDGECRCLPGYLGSGRSCLPDYDDCVLFPDLCHTNGR